MENILSLRQFCSEIGCMTSEEEPMSRHTSFQTGGSAALLAEPSTEEQIAALLAQARTLGISTHFLGKGSNLLVRDGGFDGLIIHLGPAFSDIRLENGTDIICSSGVPLAQLCQFAYTNALSGLEFAWGIPGSVGGAVYMNAGAYGGEIKDLLRWAAAVTADGKRIQLGADALELSYRHSYFTGKKDCITSACFKLSPADPVLIKARMDDYFERRRTKQPLEYPSAGSTFKRPAGNYASALIDQCGLRGFRVGGAMVSEKHAGFVINYDHATTSDILELIRQVQEIVREKTGYTLEREVELIGKDRENPCNC